MDRQIYQDRVAVITGGSQGLGLAVAKRLAEEGARGLVICGRNLEKGKQAEQTLNNLGCETIFVQADMLQPPQCHAVVDKAVEAFGKIDGLVNSAANTQRDTLENSSLDLWDNLMHTNLRAPFLTMQRAVKYMKPQGFGVLLNIISVAAYCGDSILTSYSASKGGLATLTLNVAHAYAQYGVRCNGLMLGWMDTPGEDAVQKGFHQASDDWREKAAAQMPFKQLIKPHEVAALAAHMLGKECGVMTGALIHYHQFVPAAV